MTPLIAHEPLAIATLLVSPREAALAGSVFLIVVLTTLELFESAASPRAFTDSTEQASTSAELLQRIGPGFNEHYFENV